MLPTTLQGQTIGSIAQQEIFDAPSGLIGEVTNTFHNSFYFRTIRGQLIFVTNRPLKSPITINIEPTINLENLLKPQGRLRHDGQQVHVGGNVSIDLSRAVLHRNGVVSNAQPRFSELGESLKLACFLLRIIETSQSVLDSHGLAIQGVIDFVRNGVMPLRKKGNTALFRRAALSLVGLGTGFTPSGDDVLGGFLAAYNSFAESAGHATMILEFGELQRRTSWISAKLFDYMQRLVLDEQVNCVMRSAAEGDKQSFILALQTLFPRGHTSGIDISVGILLALSLFSDFAFQTRETEETAGRLGLWSETG